MKPIFVVGNSRSGTTMMGRILGNHSRVFTFHELHFFEQLWDNSDKDKVFARNEALIFFSRLLKIQRVGYLQQENEIDFNSESQTALNTIDFPISPADLFKKFLIYEAGKNNKEFPCDQTPRNIL